MKWQKPLHLLLSNKDTREHFCGKPSSIFWKGIQVCLCIAMDCMDVTTKNSFILHPFFMLVKIFSILLFKSYPVCIKVSDWLIGFVPNPFFLAIYRICWVISSAVSLGTSVILSNFFYRVLKTFYWERTMTSKRFFGPWQAHF